MSGEPTLYRLNKFIAHSGLCSRRQAADLVKSGQVKVNGKVVTQPGVEVSHQDEVEVNGKRISAAITFEYYLLNKPKDVITTMKDDRGRKTVWDIISKKVKTRVYPVGRLDRMSTGLLLLTNDGGLAEKLSHPRFGVKKVYHVRLNKNVTDAELNKIREGIELEDGLAEVDAISHIQGGARNEVGIELHSGKNRVIRRIFEALGHEVEYLDRVYYGGLTKKDLPRGWHRPLTIREVIMLKHFQKGLK